MSKNSTRAYTPDEVHEMLVNEVERIVRLWSRPTLDASAAADGVAFSILSMLDGETMLLPRCLVIPYPHDEDAAAGENYFRPVSNGVADLAASPWFHESYEPRGAGYTAVTVDDREFSSAVVTLGTRGPVGGDE